MPELPEVETTCQGIRPYLEGEYIKKIIVRQPALRWPVPPNINQILKNKQIKTVRRRGKYLLIETCSGVLILHLGMSGHLRILLKKVVAQKHDHFDIELKNNTVLRLNDPRRFGAVLFTKVPTDHPLLVHLGPEPLHAVFTGQYLWTAAQKRRVAIKTFITNSHIVVGVGNIYAAEALFCAGIHPEKPVDKISLKQYKKLVRCIKKILNTAIQNGGTTLKNFVNGSGQAGYFKQHLKVYGRKGCACLRCKNTLQETRLGQRSTVYCFVCQT